MHMQVLTTGSWPTSPAPKCALTPELEAACKAFEDFYTEAHHGRKLAWQINMGTADVKAGFSGGRRHELNVSSYQMLVLVLFNHADSLPYREIQALTGIPHGDLRRALQSLACVKVRINDCTRSFTLAALCCLGRPAPPPFSPPPPPPPPHTHTHNSHPPWTLAALPVFPRMHHGAIMTMTA